MSRSAPRFQPKTTVLYTISKDTDLIKTLVKILDEIIAQDGDALLILSIRPIRHFIARAKELGFAMDKYLEEKRITIVDCMSRYAGDEGEKVTGAYYISSPSDLSELALVVSDIISAAPAKKEKWLVADSVSSLTLYNTAGGMLRFLHFLTSKLRILEFGGVIIITRDDAASSMNQSLKQYCDIVISED